MHHKHHYTPSDETIHPPCAWAGCAGEGTYPAPKSPGQLEERHYFCLEHIRIYNKSWNFFKNMSPEETEAYQLGAVSGHRPTWKMGIPGGLPGERERRLEAAFSRMFQQPATERCRSVVTPLPEAEQDALAVLNLDYPVAIKEIKARYKMLVKKHHPDVNNSDKRAEEIFKRISAAYTLLMNSSFINRV